MCGIAGQLGRLPPSIAASMIDTIRHRGPDDSGMFVDEAAGVALAHRRLSIIDVSSHGHQPMHSVDGRYTIIYNGEVYNFVEIRHELEKLGHCFVSQSDTEIVLAAYVQWGEASAVRLRGMFAFAIYDREARAAGDVALFLARDRFGIKPLYYALFDSTFLFASEMKALLATGVVPRRLDLEALWSYLSLGSFPQPRTAIAGVAMLRAGHFMRVRRNLSVETARYWDLADAAEGWRSEVNELDAISASRRLRELLEEATRLHMIADVPVGAFLSGGIDSTAVVGLMSRASNQRIRTYSVGFENADNSVTDEREWARLAAERFGSEHTEIVVTGADIVRQFDDIVQAIDQPSLDGTNTFLVSKAASDDIKVALSGLGGDELFAGYPHFRRLQRAADWDRRIGRIRKLLPFVPGRLLPDRDFLVATLPERYSTLRNLAEDRVKRSIINSDIANSIAISPTTDIYAPLVRTLGDSVAQTTYVETERYLVNTLLRDADAMSMAWSLEVRPVLLDHKIAEFAFALPTGIKLGAINKPALVDAVRDILPPALLNRKKTGFELPLQSWLIGPLRDRAIDTFSSSQARMLFSESFLLSTVSDIRDRRRPSIRIWAYMMLIEWVRTQGVSV